jgi:hypothetical protein
MLLPFSPLCAPLLLGALPHRSAAQAVAASRRHAGELLAWPQLPQRSFREQSLAQSVVGFPGLVLDASRDHLHVDRAVAVRGLDQLGLAYLENNVSFAALAPNDAAGLSELQRQRDGLRGVRAIKGQLLGPISVAAQLTDEQHRPLLYDDTLFDAVAQFLSLRANWQERHLSDLAATTIICLDEPLLDVVGQPFLPLDWDRVRGQIEVVFDGVSGCRAIFASGNADWAGVLETSADMIIADMFSSSHALAAAAGALAAFLERGGVVGIGIVPTDEDALAQATPDSLARRVGALARELAAHGIRPELLLAQAVITSSGTLGRLNVPAAERALQMAAELSHLLREQYSLR